VGAHDGLRIESGPLLHPEAVLLVDHEKPEVRELDAVGDAPGLVEVEKTGRLVGGRVRWTVTPTASGADVEWRQRLTIAWLPGWADPLVGVVGRAAYALGLRRLLPR